MMARGLTSVKDPTSGFMAIRKEILRTLTLDPIGWKIVLDAVVRSKSKKVKEVPIIFSDREIGEQFLEIFKHMNLKTIPAKVDYRIAVVQASVCSAHHRTARANGSMACFGQRRCNDNYLLFAYLRDSYLI